MLWFYLEKQAELRNFKGEIVGEILLRVEMNENHEIISGIFVPDLSLAADRVVVARRYNAIDGYNPNSKSNRANCFSFFDGDKIPGFDHLDVFPAKYVLPKDIQWLLPLVYALLSDPPL